MSSSDTTGDASETHDCSKCSIHPSCALFPRRPDGRIVLPQPQRGGGSSSHTPAAVPSESKNDDKGKERANTQATYQQHPVSEVPVGHDASSSRSRQVQPQPSVAQTRPIHGSNPVWNSNSELQQDTTNQETQTPRPTPQVVENYAQLSSLPQFRAFKLNNTPDTGINDTGLTSVGGTRVGITGPFMQEIVVVPRTRKQNYIRSDSNYRMYKGNRDAAGDKDTEDPEGSNEKS